MWPLTYCGGDLLSCLNWFGNLPALHMLGVGLGVMVCLFILLRIVSGIFKFFGFDDIGH